VAGASRTLDVLREARTEVRLAELAVAVAGAVDAPDLVERLALALEEESGGHVPARIWLVEESKRPRLLARHAAGSNHPRGEARAVVAAALSDSPLRAGSALLVSLCRAGSPFAVLAVGARGQIGAEVLADLAPVVAARLQAFEESELDRFPSAAIRRAETATDTHAVIAAFAAEAMHLLEHDRLSVYMLTADGRSFERFGVATSPVLPGEGDVIPLEDVGLTYVLQANRPFVSEDLATDERLVGREDSVIAAAGFHGLVSVPLRIGGKPIGLLNFVSRTPGFYTSDDAAVAQQLADQVAIFFQNLRLEQRVRMAIEREAAQQERSRLAHELHDTLAQSLAEMLVKLDLLGTRLGRLDAEAEREVAAMRTEAQTMLDELRRSLLRLQPAELEKTSLADAVAGVLEALEAEHGVKTTFELVGSLSGLPPEVETTVFRIFQEAVTNARKHARASAVTVTLRVGEGLVLSIEDNGVGFVPSGHSEGFGLQSMRQRAEEIGGRLIMTATSGRGTSVNLSLPALSLHRTPAGPPPAPPARDGTTLGRVMRVLVVDDHPLFREAVSHILEREADIRVVGQVGTAQEAIASVKRLRPDLLLLDVELPDASGIDVVRRLAALEHAPPALMVSAFPESGHVVAAMKAGARGYLAKTIDRESLVESIRAIARGATIFDSSGAGLWTPRRLAQLTRRELDVLGLVAEGKTNAEIADELCLAKKTVERIVATAVAKLCTRNRAHAVAKAVALKVIDVRAD
jgi:signal transduction histidine kinase/DNA-binding NarL/FixJ family response regulator